MERKTPVSRGALADRKQPDEYLHLLEGGKVSGPTTFTNTVDVGNSDDKKLRMNQGDGTDSIGLMHQQSTLSAIAQRANGDTTVRSSWLQLLNPAYGYKMKCNVNSSVVAEVSNANGMQLLVPCYLANLTTTERDALAGAAGLGSMIYNSSTHKFQCLTNASNSIWVDLH